MGYSLDLEKISLVAYKQLLRDKYLTPGRRVLHEDMDTRFEALARAGITNLLDLEQSLTSSKKLQAFADKSGLSADYLKILRREVGSLVPKAVALDAFLTDKMDALNSLNEAGLETSQDYYLAYQQDPQQVWDLGVDVKVAECLLGLCSLSRINGVGPQAARAFYKAGYRSVSDVANTDAETMLDRVSTANASGEFYKAKLGVKDMQFCIDHAQLLHQQS